MKKSCVRKIHFCAGHRVFGHENKCARLHGHNYVAWIYATAPELDKIGRVVDFSVIKNVVGGWIEENWDHRFILWFKDGDVEILSRCFGDSLARMELNPTAENMALMLMKVCEHYLPPDIIVDKIELYETENCKAVVTR